MIVCHCNVVSKQEIVETIHDFLHHDPWQLVVPLQVYHALQKRGRCCGCFSGVVDIIARTTETFHRDGQTPEAEIISLLDRLRKKQNQMEKARQAALRHMVA